MSRTTIGLLLAPLLVLGACSSRVKGESGGDSGDTGTESGGTMTSGIGAGGTEAGGESNGAGTTVSGDTSSGGTSAGGSSNGGTGGSAAGEAGAGGMGAAGEGSGGDGSGGDGQGGTGTGGSGGSESSSTGGGTSSTGGSGGTGGAGLVCEDDEVCVPPVPEDWSGPVAAVDEFDVACPPDYPTLALEAGSNPSSGGSCGCSCPTPTGTCGSSATGRTFSNSTCSGEPDGSASMTTTNCAFSTGSLEIVVAAPSSVSCGAGSTTDELVPAQFDDELSLCIGATGSASCEGQGTCFPEPAAPFAADVCVFRRGEHACPAAYPTGALYYEELLDTRDCPATCSCNAEGGECTASFALLGSCAIAGGGFGTASSAAPTCREMGGDNATSARLGTAPSLADASCVPVPPSPSGQVVSNEPVTLCCL